MSRGASLTGVIPGDARLSAEPDFAALKGWGRLWAFLRAAAFVALFVGASIGINVVLHRALGPNATMGVFYSNILLASATLAITFIMSLIARRPFGAYGLGGAHRGRNFFIGTIAGVALLAGLLASLNFAGVFTFGVPDGDPQAIASYAALYAIMFLAVALNEEALFRGFVLIEFGHAISFWPAALILAALFGVPHALNEGPAGIVGGSEAALFALVAAYTLRVTGSLWLIIGLHFGWDYAETFLFGVPDSGLVLPGGLMHPLIHGPDWLTGGSAGPEGSVLCTIPVLLMALLAWALRRRASA